MKNYTIDDLLPRSGMSVYRLVKMASDRAVELAEGKPTLLDKKQTDKLTSIALEEISQGKIESVEGTKYREDLEKEEALKEESDEKEPSGAAV